MSEAKYKFDPSNLEYVKIKLTFWDYMKRFLGVMLLAFLIAVVIFYLYYKRFDSLKDKALKYELNILRIEYESVNKRVETLNEVLTKIKNRDHNIYRTLFEASPLDEIVLHEDYSKKYEQFASLENKQLLAETKERLDHLALDLYEQSLSLTDLEGLVKDQKNRLDSKPAIQPVSNKKLKKMASGYGYRLHPIYKTRKFHAGMDFSAAKGTPIYATGDGVVIVARMSKRGLGHHLVINHGYGYITVYGHMAEFEVKRKQKVKRGQVIGYVGNTGASTGPHLHYEVKKNGKHVNPINYYYNDLTPEEYEQMLEMSSLNRQSLD